MDVSMGEQAWRLADEDDEDISINTRHFPAAVTPARSQLPYTPIAPTTRSREPYTPSAQLVPATPMRSFTTRTPGVILHEATNILTYSTDRSALRPDDAEENAFAVKQKAFLDAKKKGQVNVLALLRLCDDFQRICRERCEHLLTAYPILNSDEGPFPTSAEFLRAQQEFLLLRSERDTWELIRRLYELHGTDLLLKNTTLPSHATPRDAAQIYYHTNADFRRYHIVLNWLEEISAQPVESSREKVAWRTKEILRAAQTRLKPMSADLVSEADPDAPLRQGRRLEDGDTEAEQRVLRDTWKLLRAGAHEDAKVLCRAAGMQWLAAAIGANLWDDPQLHDEKERPSGTQSYDLWLDVCSKISNEESVYSFERAVFGSLCGNLNAMKLVCASWADQLWASYKHRAHFALQRELHRHRAQFGDMEEFSAPKDGAAVERAAAEPEQAIYDTLLRSDTRMEVRREANEPYHALQGLVILNQIGNALRTLADWAKRIEGGRTICPPQLLRFATHFILFLDEMRVLGPPDAVPSLTGFEEARSTIIGAYIRHLISAGHGAWVAFFTARLPESQQVNTYVEFLATLKQTDNAALSRAKEAGLDAKAIALKTATRATDTPVAPMRGMPSAGTGQLTADEEERIRAVEWLSVSPSWLYDLLLQTNKLARAFMLEGRSAAMEALFTPGRSLIISDKRNIFEHETLASAPSGGDSDYARKLNACKEHRCYEAYMRAQHALLKWQKPESDKWTEEQLRLFNGAYEALIDVLKTPGGWLEDVEYTEDAAREEQLRLIQQRCVPAICFTVHHLCVEAKRLKESVEIANIIVDEELQDNFSPEELQQLLRQIGNSVVELLRNAPDGRLPL